MVLPVSIMRAACDGDSAKVWAWLDAPDAVGPRDINDVATTANGTTLLMAATMRIDSVGKLDFIQELVRRGADYNFRDDDGLGIYGLACTGVEFGKSRADVFRDFTLQWLNAPDVYRPPKIVASIILTMAKVPSRPLAEAVFALVRAGVPLVCWINGEMAHFMSVEENSYPELAQDEHWIACRSLIAGVRAAGSWRAYVRLPREEVLRLRSLVIRGRARPRVRTRAADPIVARVVRLPNELVWKVLAYWRCTSDVTGEVI